MFDTPEKMDDESSSLEFRNTHWIHRWIHFAPAALLALLTLANVAFWVTYDFEGSFPPLSVRVTMVAIVEFGPLAFLFFGSPSDSRILLAFLGGIALPVVMTFVATKLESTLFSVFLCLAIPLWFIIGFSLTAPMVT